MVGCLIFVFVCCFFPQYSPIFTFLHFLPHFLVCLNQDRKGQMSCVLVPQAFSRGPGSRMICYSVLIIEINSQWSPVGTVHFRSSWQDGPELGKKMVPPPCIVPWCERYILRLISYYCTYSPLL